MKLSSLLPVMGRRAVATSVAILLCAVSASSVRAQQAAAQTPAQPAAQQQQPPDSLKLDFDVPVLLIFQIKPDRVADFESLWPGLRAAVSAAVAKKPNDELKAFAETLVPLKVQNLPGVYVFRLDQPSKKFSYNPPVLLYYTDTGIPREDADVLYKKWNECWTNVQIWPLSKMGG